MIKYLIGTTLALGALYGGFEAWPLIAGPHISLVSPTQHATIADGLVTIAGSVRRVARLTLNGMDVLRDQNGAFSSTLTFPRGGSILTFEATDRFGRTQIITRSIFVQ